MKKNKQFMALLTFMAVPFSLWNALFAITFTKMESAIRACVGDYAAA